jgi:hypothetical protein
MALPAWKGMISISPVNTCPGETYVDSDAVEQVVRREHEASGRRGGSRVGHDLCCDVLLEVEGAGVHEVPERAAAVEAAARLGKGVLEELAEHVRKQLKEERGHADDLRPELEEHAEDGAEDGEAEADKVHPEGVDAHRRVILERAQGDSKVLGRL